MGWLIVGAILGIAGFALDIVQGMQEAEAQAAADALKAEELEELSKEGGYYDQQLAALAKEFEDIEADRIAAMQVRAIETLSISEQGAEARGSILARAGAGGLAAEGSVLRREETVKRQVQRGTLKLQLQYEDVQRGLVTREAQARAQETFVEFKKESGLAEAKLLRGEADWLKTWDIFSERVGAVVEVEKMNLDWVAK